MKKIVVKSDQSCCSLITWLLFLAFHFERSNPKVCFRFIVPMHAPKWLEIFWVLIILGRGWKSHFAVLYFVKKSTYLGRPGCSSPPRKPMGFSVVKDWKGPVYTYTRRVYPSVLSFSLSSHRHTYINLLCSFRLSINNEQQAFFPGNTSTSDARASPRYLNHVWGTSSRRL